MRCIVDPDYECPYEQILEEVENPDLFCEECEVLL